MSNISKLISDRLGGEKFLENTGEYKFETIKQAKKIAISLRPTMKIIDMGIGEPDEMANSGVIEKLYEEAKKWENRDYADNGIQEFKDAAVIYLEKVYGVIDINKITEINHVIGSKSALAMIPQICINPGDIALVTVPGYPVMSVATKWLGGEVYHLPLHEKNNFLPDLNSIPKDILEKSKILYINYPNNPTGAVGTKQFFEQVVCFAKQNNIIVVNDAAYGALVYGDEKPLSFLSVDGAKAVGIEVHSLSKAFNMTGWRLGFVVGNEIIVKAFATVKDNMDCGQFKAIQKAGIYALEHSEITQKTILKYERRHIMLVEVLRRLGFEVNEPKGSFYLYVSIPKEIKDGIKFENAEQFSKYLIEEKSISTVPWDDVGNYIRFSVTFIANGEEEEKKVIDELYNRLKDTQFIF